MTSTKLIAALTCSFLATSVLAQTYSAMPILVDGQAAIATDLNNHGQVVGYLNAAQTRGFVTAPDAGPISFLTMSPGLGNAKPTSINDNGWVAGDADTPVTQYFYSAPQSVVSKTRMGFVAGPDLQARTLYNSFPSYGPDYVARPYETVLDINENNYLLMKKEVLNLNENPYFVLAPKADGTYSYAYEPPFQYRYGDVNNYQKLSNANQVVGTAYTNRPGFSGYDHAAVVVNPDNSKVFAPPAYNDQNVEIAAGSTGKAINASGQVAGERLDRSQIFIADAGFESIQLLGNLGGSLSSVSDMNDLGQIVGWSNDANQVARAFVTGVNGGGLVDLNTLVALPSGQYFSKATAINNLGQMLAQTNTGIYYFLNPSAVPEPSTWITMVAGLLGIGFVVRKKAVATN